MSILNQFSFVLVSLLLFVVIGSVLWRWKRPPRWLKIGGFGVVVVAVIAFGLWWRYPADNSQNLKNLDEQLSDGQPTFVMLYSNY